MDKETLARPGGRTPKRSKLWPFLWSTCAVALLVGGDSQTISNKEVQPVTMTLEQQLKHVYDRFEVIHAKNMGKVVMKEGGRRGAIHLDMDIRENFGVKSAEGPDYYNFKGVYSQALFRGKPMLSQGIVEFDDATSESATAYVNLLSMRMPQPVEYRILTCFEGDDINDISKSAVYYAGTLQMEGDMQGINGVRLVQEPEVPKVDYREGKHC